MGFGSIGIVDQPGPASAFVHQRLVEVIVLNVIVNHVIGSSLGSIFLKIPDGIEIKD